MNGIGKDHLSDALPRVGSAVIVRDEANRILLGKRNKDPHRGSWILPGGKIKAFESIAEAAMRELQEETGLDIEVQKQFRVYEVINPPDEHRIIIYSLARMRGGSLRAADDVSEVKFVSFDELGALPLTPLVRRVLQDAGYMEKEPPPHRANVFLDTEFLFPMPIAGAITRRRSRTRRRSTPGHVHRVQISRQACLSFDGGLRD
jgi:ADP-ribose pyrophosphatase YjhB (NUDIX family)